MADKKISVPVANLQDFMKIALLKCVEQISGKGTDLTDKEVAEVAEKLGLDGKTLFTICDQADDVLKELHKNKFVYVHEGADGST